MPPAPDPPARLNPTVRDFVLRLAIVFGIFFAVGLLSGPSDRPHRATFADFLAAVERGDIEHAVLETRDNSIRAEGMDGRVYAVGYPPPYAADARQRTANGERRRRRQASRTPHGSSAPYRS